MPYIEKTFRGIGQPWARFMYGGSTGGWEALGGQVLYPDDYNGCLRACPDPIDFRAYTVVDIYKDKNAYFRRTVPKQRRGPAIATTSGTIALDPRRDEPSRAGARHEEPVGPAVGHLGSGLLTGRPRRLSASASGTSAPA